MEEGSTSFEGSKVNQGWVRSKRVFEMTLNLIKKWEFQQKYQPVQKYIYRVWPKIENWSLIETAKNWKSFNYDFLSSSYLMSSSQFPPTWPLF